DKSGVPVIRASDLVVKESTPGVKIEPTVLATNTTVARDLSNTIAPAKDTSNTAASSKTEVASSSPVSGFQSVASASLRPDAVVEKSGKIVSSEALVVTPIAPVTRAVYTPTAVTPEASVAATTSRAETTATAPAVDKSGVPVIRASDLVVKESTPGVKIEPTALATNTTVARDLNSTTVPTKDTGSIPPSSKTEVASSSPVSGFQSVASASLRPDGIVDKNGKTISAESFAVAPIVPVTKASASLTNSPASAAAAADTVSFTNQASGSKVVSSTDSNPQSTIRTDAAMAITTSAITSAVAKELTAKAEPTMRVLDNLQTAANSTAPKAIGTEHGQIGQISQLNQLNQPTTALSAALAAAINGRMLGHQTETSKPFINGQGTAAMIDTSAVATTKGSIITVAANTKTEPGSGAGNRGEGVAPAKTDAVSVNAEIRFPLGTKVKKSETEEGDDDGKTTTATSAKVFGAGGNGGAGTNSGTGTGTGTTNTANGQVIDPSVAGMIGGTITPKPFDLPPLEITDKENENGRATKSNGSNNAANNSGNKVNGGPSQKEMSDALQALIEKRRKERTRKPVTSTGKKTPVYKPEKQRRCLVLKGDTLDSLAEQYLADSNLAELIYEINKGFWREKRRAGVVYLEFIPGSTIFLPTEEEIALFRRKKLEGGKPYLSFKCAPPKAVRSLRQSVKQNQQQQEATVELKLDPKLDLEPEQDTVVIAEAVPPTVFTANAPANSENSIEKALAVQLIAHLAQVSDTSRLLQPNQAKQVRELEETSRVTVVGEQSAVDATGYVARIEVLCENVWQPVMEYIIDGALGDATLKIYSLGGKVREIDLDLPLSIIREMAFNDLTANRLNYCKKYLLGRKIFC
ncbi:MAG: hypothetical protein QG574_5468, partial [Cyanobacteriota bacterium erpe_2018_sw_21hr_WHONDRS-SW48-000092_B_bin.40]|nr:hypothetical protein [Cyanobacteriota bacterium erpe_2018_sw_21hr_WHONDRS-SW48-000092_B_bin.40]